ncbi:MAG: hypothetical protein CVV31_12740 [Methanomicrobiales archaeon HGW-Methanomicrobiales-2]|nr:MAG: hypothetical protein CVV31_12740 [Methanomicrobiales archaeon HGW-Methanomicrobiales-2]
MIEIYQQKMAMVLTVAIQALVVGGLIACIVVGTQDRPSPVVSPAGGPGSLDYRPESASPAAYPIVHPPKVMPVIISPGTGEELISSGV